MATRPLILADLDDTLFQTARKMVPDSPRTAATVDKEGNANGFMSTNQSVFTNWLLIHGDVIPVTARSVDAFTRVRLPFQHGAICSHGGVILDRHGKEDSDWQLQIRLDLAAHQDALYRVFEEILIARQELQANLRITLQEASGQVQFVMVKQSGGSDEVLAEVLSFVKSNHLCSNIYTHRNGNNLAFIPTAISKERAVSEWLRRDRAIHGERPVIGLGDSITDLGFLALCDWWGTPKQGQLADWIKDSFK